MVLKNIKKFDLQPKYKHKASIHIIREIFSALRDKFLESFCNQDHPE